MVESMKNKKLNHETRLRISEKTKTDIIEIAEALGFKEQDFVRLLLTQAIQKVKQDAIKSGGYDGLEVHYGRK